MYRFYAEVAARNRRSRLPPAQPRLPARSAARGHHAANPSHPDRESQQPHRHRIGIDAIERILKAAPHAAVLIDEAYYEFFGVTALDLIAKYPNLFVSRTFSKVYGMAAMRMGCLFSQPANVQFLHKAQSPYSVNITRRAGRRSRRAGHRLRRRLRDRSPRRARSADAKASTKLGIAYVPSSANFVLGYFGSAPSKCATHFARKPSSSATAATKSPAASASPWARANRRAECSKNWSASGEKPDRLRHGRRAGRCQRILPRRHPGHGQALHRRRADAR
jgi:hypothetical protein